MLEDCSTINLDLFAKSYFGKKKADKDRALTWLRELAANKWSEDSFFSLGNDKKQVAEPIVYTDMYGTWWTGRYIGSVSFKGITVDIRPRFGIQFAMDNMPLVNVMLVDIERSFGKGGQFVHYLQGMLWLNELIKAARHALPSVKLDERHESFVCRGRLDVRGTVKQRVKASEKVVSISRHKDLINPVSIAVVLAFREIQNWFPNHDVMHFLPATVALRLQQMIDVVKRHSKAPSYTEISKVRLSSIARGYKSLAVMSLDILKRKGVSERTGEQSNKTLLLDVAEVWEYYLLNVLLKAVAEAEQEGVDVEHGTHAEGSYLLKSSHRETHLGKLLPDYFIKQGEDILLIADAKYKRLGDAPWQSPKRDDLYQMTAYMNAHPNCKRGALLYPQWDEELSSRVEENNPWILQSEQEISFITVSPVMKVAVKELQALGFFSAEDKTYSSQVNK